VSSEVASLDGVEYLAAVQAVNLQIAYVHAVFNEQDRLAVNVPVVDTKSALKPNRKSHISPFKCRRAIRSMALL
jgi:hypothetical protein